MNKEQGPADAAKKSSGAKGEFILIAILAIFVVVAIIGMMIIDHYGTQRMGDPARIHDAADR